MELNKQLFHGTSSEIKGDIVPKGDKTTFGNVAADNKKYGQDESTHAHATDK
jgi:hypothetical protein